MTLQLDWPPELVDQLAREARQRGIALDAYLLETMLQRRSQAGAPSAPESHRRRAEAAIRIQELSERVKPDPEGWTSRQHTDHERR